METREAKEIHGENQMKPSPGTFSNLVLDGMTHIDAEGRVSGNRAQPNISQGVSSGLNRVCRTKSVG